MKRKAVKATLRKESQTFDGWLKYEVEIQNENGSIETVPAYGKDLQDALSRVVHDEMVVELEKKTKRIPDGIWVTLWFGYIFSLTLAVQSVEQELRSIFILGGLALITTLTLAAKRWFRKRNVSK